MGDEDWNLAIGSILGDSDSVSRAWGRAIGALSLRVMAPSEKIDTPLRVNVIFHLDGEYVQNDFEGVRTGSFLKAKSLLIVQAALEGGAVDDYDRVLAPLVDAAVEEAELWAKRRKVAEGLPGLRDLVGRLRAGEI